MSKCFLISIQGNVKPLSKKYCYIVNVNPIVKHNKLATIMDSSANNSKFNRVVPNHRVSNVFLSF